MEGYKTLDGQSQFELEEKHSRFISQAAFADSEEQALAFLEAVRAQHRTANHNVYAYVLRAGARARYSDDGEPAKTSGLPTLEAIQHAGLVDCIVVTTRYFGGTLLGTGGLVRAYTQAAAGALAAARTVEVRVCVQGTWTVDYALYETAQKLLAAAGARVGAPVFAARVALPFTMPAGTEEALRAQAQELCRGRAELTLSQPFHAPF